MTSDEKIFEINCDKLLLTVFRQRRAMVSHLFGHASVDRRRAVEYDRKDLAVVVGRDQRAFDMVMMDNQLVMVELRLLEERLA
jgi:hypothetical protein